MNKPPKNNPSDVLSSWLALEVLSPQTFNRPEDLTSSFGSIAYLNEGALPWEGIGEKSKPNYRLYYQVVISTINFEKAISALLDIYADKRPERPAFKGEAILATIIIDSKGLAVGKSIAISSFAWGFARALKSNLTDLASWSVIERAVTERSDAMLKRKDKNGNQLPVNKGVIEYIRKDLIAEFGLPMEYVTNTCFAIRCYQYMKNPEPPEPMLLNSFFLADLEDASRLFKEKKATPNLRKYLKEILPDKRLDILNDRKALESVISPSLIPPSRWPGAGRHPLVLLQQAAINVAFKELKVDGILAVNGPPGTGKTTLLRDIVAGLITKRAEAMCKFANPADAFEDSGEKISLGQAFFRLYHINPAIRGFEMLITSSNNKAVENVSAELPGINAIAEDAGELRYFTSLSDTLLNRESWGLIAAVLGNAGNLNNFKQKFWWDKEVGFSTYLTEAAGTPQFIEEVVANGKIEKRKPRIVVEEDAPGNHEDALYRWKQVKVEFQHALEACTLKIATLEKIRQTVLNLSVLEEKEAQAKESFTRAAANEEQYRIEKDIAFSDLSKSSITLELIILKLSTHLRRKPGWWARLFRTKLARAWKKEYEQYEIEKEEATKIYNNLKKVADKANDKHQHAIKEQNDYYQFHLRIINEAIAAKKKIAESRQLLGTHLIDTDFFRLVHDKRHLVSPWCDDKTQLLRDKVFIKAIKLHKAFIDAAAKPLKHNLGVLMQIFSGQGLTSDGQMKVLPDLWSSLFIVVPGLSTTFASVSKMLGKLPPESIGWLLIDEAGQALPQAAVGAIMRTRRAVVVGDPVQIEPVVVLPDILTQSICRTFGVDPLLFNAPIASAQTLADAATPYFAEFEGKLGSRVVGVPLLVHRRCEDPMFGVSNAIAYERLMVKAKNSGRSAIRDCLGQSVWIDIQGTQGQDKWSLDEGMVVIRLLERLKAARIVPDIYIVTPFVIVAERLRNLIKDSSVLESWVSDPVKWPRERVGTVHTVQGRESEAVFFVLGAPLQSLGGARGWAGGKPNLVNVAVTRAKEVIYVIGNRNLWKEVGVFRELSERLPVSK